VNNIITRTITGVLFISILIGAILWNAFTFAFIFLIITILALWEFFTLLENEKVIIYKPFIVAIGAMLFVINALFAMNIAPIASLFLMLPLIILVFIIELYQKNEKPFTNIAYSIFGIVYLAVPFSILNYFPLISGNTKYNSNLLLGYFLIIWMYDTSAYIFGISFGKHRLFERISPKKSWEGFIGGTICSLGFAYLLSIFFMNISLVDWIAITLIIIVFGTFGDLVESLFKRSINCKDSGKILPGHGGILDRFDAVLISAPIVFTYFVIINYFK